MFARPRIRKTAPPPPKKRKTVHAIEEITFDKDARAEFLTGFHKRKQARIKHAQEIREERRQAVEDHVRAVNKILREAEHAGTEQHQNSSEEEWGGFSDTDVPEAPIDLEEEYIDEDRFTTVTVEAVSVDRDGLHKPDLNQPSEDEGSEPEEKGDTEQEGGQKRVSKRPKDSSRKKKKKFRYENKLQRELEARKQRAKRRKR
ncbi:9a0a7437-d87a-4718-8868-a19eea745a7f [Thermothielavioides terrestris]|uniref:9a0a7437-d87a-4718-8868-a19eea745a7f n=1 Tax=Thermothielavioides terrestris TaxID=2587410 RepID=A0A446BGH5_9PEZI|nr:9a0a7437-d87a-4718-8868-a19eea745a7f [Thermothielavioides terrestris]